MFITITPNINPTAMTVINTITPIHIAIRMVMAILIAMVDTVTHTHHTNTLVIRMAHAP